MSKRAEELAKQLYPDPKLEDYDDVLVYRADRDNAIMGRINVVRVYEQAKKDLGWISVKDRLPEKDGWYFTCVEMSGVPQCVGLSHFETYSGQWDDDDDSIELVDYWMPIPELPKEDEK